MAKFLIQASYSADGLKGLQKDGGTGRRNAAASAIEAAGGKLESMYFAFGDHDIVAIADFPDNILATALAVTISSSGLVRIRTTPLMTAQEVDAAMKKTIAYKPPGR
jgi:uncharacterized protein with GYD domain